MIDGVGVRWSVTGLAGPVAATTHSNTAFAVVFGIFVVAMLILTVVIVTWAVRRDRTALTEWRRRRAERAFGQRGNGSGGPPSGNGRQPGTTHPEGAP